MLKGALPVLLALIGCQSGIELDPMGQYRCLPERTTARSFGGCPTGLFCGADRTCHRVDVGGDYECLADFGCGGDFRCGPLRRCVDPRADGLRTDGVPVVLSAVRTIAPRTPWTMVSAVGAGRQFFNKGASAGLTDIAPIAVAQGKDLYSVATSSLGFGGNEHFYVGKATLNEAIIDAVPIRQQVYALTADKLYRYSWPANIDGGIQPIAFGASALRIGERLRVGNSAFPIVAEFSLDLPRYRLHDAARPDFADAGPAWTAPNDIDDIVDTDGLYVYASFGGLLHGAPRKDVLSAIAGGREPLWTPSSLVSPGRNEFLTNCAAGSVADKLTIRAIRAGDNPDLTQVERPLVALEVDVTRADGGREPTHWMRIDPDPTIGGCAMVRHVARGFCPACQPGDDLKDLQWGRTSTNQPVLHSECAPRDGGAPLFYSLATDSTGFACIRERRPNSGLPGAPTSRQRSSATVAAAAVDTRIYVRRDAEDPYLGLTLEQAPELVDQQTAFGLVALAGRAIFRETPNLGLALSNFAQRTEVFPTAVVQGSTWLIRDDGSIIDLADFGRASEDATILAAPARKDLKAPFLGARATTPDGGTLLVMASFDALLAGSISPDAGRSTIDVRAVPEGQVPILSLAVVPPEIYLLDGGVQPLASGYVLTRNRLFAFRAVTELQWNVQSVTLTEGDWMKVWVDERRGRIGYRDGSVYALPSAVRVAPPIAPASVVQDFVHYCGRSYALTADALYRLDVVSGAPIGAWTRQDLAELTGTRWKKLHPTRNGSLWVFTDDGRGVSLKGTPCGQ